MRRFISFAEVICILLAFPLSTLAGWRIATLPSTSGLTGGAKATHGVLPSIIEGKGGYRKGSVCGPKNQLLRNAIIAKVVATRFRQHCRKR